jgi:predicted transcriptional regulator
VKPESRTPNVRISPHAHELLRQLAEEEQASMQAILDKAIERYRRESFLRAANSEFEALQGDPRAWKHEAQERQAWEQTLPDALEKNR